MTRACDPQHAFSRIWRILDLFNSFLRLFEGLMVKYSQISSSSREFQHRKFLKIFYFNSIDIWGFLKSFLQMVEDLKVKGWHLQIKNWKGYRSLIMRSAHSITSCDQKTINVPQIINVKIITSDLLTQFEAFTTIKFFVKFHHFINFFCVLTLAITFIRKP